MQKPINEIERLKLIAGLINEVEYTDAVYGVNRKTVLTEAKKKEVKKKEVTIDTVNPYEYRHGIQFELTELDDYSDEALEKAKATVLKNLAKDANFYSTLLNAKQSPFTFKQTETDAPGMQANADGTLKKGAGKLDKSNVKDNLGKKEAGKKKPKGVKVMPDKGVEGKEKVVKEGIETNKQKLIDAGYSESDAEDFADEFEQGGIKVPQKVKDILTNKKEGLEVNPTKSYHGSTANQGDTGWTIDFTVIENTPEYFKIDYVMTPNSSRAPMGASRNYRPEKKYGEWKISKVGDNGEPLNDWEKSQLNIKGDHFRVNGKEFVSDIYGVNEDNMESSPVNGDSSAEGQFNQLMSKYDWYYEMSDDPRKYDTGKSIDQQLKSLATTIGIDRAVELFNLKAPSDRKVTSTFFMEGKVDKHTKIKEALKSALKKKVTEDDAADETAKKSAIQTEKAKLIALNKQKSELLADKTKAKEVKDTEMKGIDLKIRSANDQLTKLNQGKIDVV
jgi:hypothetical protein